MLGHPLGQQEVTWTNPSAASASLPRHGNILIRIIGRFPGSTSDSPSPGTVPNITDVLTALPEGGSSSSSSTFGTSSPGMRRAADAPLCVRDGSSPREPSTPRASYPTGVVPSWDFQRAGAAVFTLCLMLFGEKCGFLGHPANK